jgi:hypothetical protein
VLSDDGGHVPLIEIQTLPRPEIDHAAVSRRLNAAIAEALGCRLDAVWTTWRTIDSFARGDGVSTTHTGATFGPVVHVYHHRTPEQVDRVVDVIERVLASELSLGTDDVFVTTQPVAIEAPDLG